MKLNNKIAVVTAGGRGIGGFCQDYPIANRQAGWAIRSCLPATDKKVDLITS